MKSETKQERLAELIRRARALKTPMPTLISFFEKMPFSGLFSTPRNSTPTKSEGMKNAEQVFMRAGCPPAGHINFPRAQNISPFLIPPCYRVSLQNPHHGPARALPAGLPRGFLLLWTALGLLATHASARVDYVRDIVQPDGMAQMISAPQAPYEISGSDYPTPASPTPYFFTLTSFYRRQLRQHGFKRTRLHLRERDGVSSISGR